MNTSSLKLDKSFYYLAWATFFGALNDNIYKWLITFFLISRAAPDSTTTIVSTGGIVFVAPFLIFTTFAGSLADRFGKKKIIVTVKVIELFVMIIGCAAFLTAAAWPLYVVLFLMAAQSAFYSPARFGIIPELVPTDRLSKANGIIEMLTYFAIIAGVGIAILLSLLATVYLSGNYSVVCIIAVAISVAGFVTSLFVKNTVSAGGKQTATAFVFRDVYRTLKSVSSDGDLLTTLFASAFFLFIGAFVQQNTIPYSDQQLNAPASGAGVVFLMMALGIAAGSMLAAKFSGRGIEMGLIPLGSVGMAVTISTLGIVNLNFVSAAVIVFVLGVSGGLFIVPVHAFIQARSPREKLGKVIAASNFIGWIGVLLSSLLLMFFHSVLSLSPKQIFLVLGSMMSAATVFTIIKFPQLAIRIFCIVITRFVYRIKTCNVENVPQKGGALLVCNHMSWADALMVSAKIQRPLRFVMNRELYSKPFMKPFMDILGVIPISRRDHPKQIISSIKQARQALDDGWIVCIFAEGTITRTGLPNPFKSGVEKILRGKTVPVIPAYIGGAWGSVLSYYHGKLFSRLPRRFPRPISVYFGSHMPADSSAFEIRQKVIELSSEYFGGLKSSSRSLAGTFISAARSNRGNRCIADDTSKGLTYGRTLVSAIALRDRIKPLCAGSDNVGILLPPSTAAAITNIAVSMLGKTSVNLNYTVSEQSRQYAVDQCGIERIVTSKKFIERTGMLPDRRFVFVEDIFSAITGKDRLFAFLKSVFVPSRMLIDSNGGRFSSDTAATIIFSSGSTGTPKGVVLSHHNILSNIEAIRYILQVGHEDNLCAVLPMFHSFGFTCGLWLPLICGASVTFVANPLDSKLVGQSVSKHGSTVLFAPPTFLSSYVRRVEPEQFKTLRIIAAGAEKLKPSLVSAFEDRFGKTVLEGYGATELSPVASFNIPDVLGDDFPHVGCRPGTVGHPLPGVCVRVVDPSDGRILGCGCEGLIRIKGPNVMTGYLNRPDLTEKVICDGWYDTGDIGRLDNDGFITITDRLARFSKIGGEMIPHLAIEEVICRSLETHEQVLAVTGIPDERKGEQIVVLYTEAAGPVSALRTIIEDSDLPNIFKPKRDNFILIDKLPLLGSGKLDIMKLRNIAEQNACQGCFDDSKDLKGCENVRT